MVSEPPELGAPPWNALLRGPAFGVLVFCWLGWAFDFYDLILFAFVKAEVGAELGLDPAALAWIDGATFAGAALGGIAFGRIADRAGRRPALCASILLFSLGAFATGFADGFTSLLVARVITGLGAGGEWGVGHAAVAEAYPAASRNRAAALLQAATPVGLLLAALVGCFLAPRVGWRATFIGSAIPAVLVVFARWAMPDGAASVPGERMGLRRLFDGERRRRTLRLFAVLVLHMTGFWSCYAWLPTLLLREGGASLAFVGLFHAGLAVVHVFADLIFGPLADRFGRRRVFVALCLLSAVGLAAIGVGFARLQSDLMLSGVALAAVGLGAGTWSAFGTWFADGYPPALRATASSGLYNLARGSQLIAQPLLGMAFVATGSLAVALWVGVGCAVGSALLAPRGET